MADKTEVEDFSKMKVAELKKVLKDRGLATSGSKSDLVERLRDSALEGSFDHEATFFDDKLLDSEFSLSLSTVDTSAILDEESALDVDLNEDSEPKTEDKVELTDKTPENASTLTKITSPDDPEKKAVGSALSPAERLKQRAERFGVMNEDLKKQARADRFGTSTGDGKLSSAGTGADVDALKKRAERFGQVLSSTLSKSDEEDRLKKRKERFGEVLTTSNKPQKFAKITYNASSGEDDKKKKRAERFQMS